MSNRIAENSLRRILTMVVLIAAGEAVFLLPFVLIRIFRPTFLKVFEINNLQLGTAFSAYGILAMISYFAGGPLADRYSARRLMTVALLITGLGGFVFIAIPDLYTLTLLYAFWGMTTILLFWAALIRATREWGGDREQGRAYGLLDGGRGLYAAILASVSLWVFSMILPVNPETASALELERAFKWVIGIYTGAVMVSALLVWVFIPESNTVGSQRQKLTLTGVKQAMSLPQIWLQAIIVVCAYVGYKCTDDFSLYASDAFGYNDVEAAQVGTFVFWIRPVAAILAGFIGDQIKASMMTIIAFGLMVVGSLVIGLGFIQPGFYFFLMFTIAAISAGAYALRGVYFALLQEGHIPLAITGSAIGVVSVLGFTPDIFMGPLMGYLIDNSPGALGHQHVFLVLALFGSIGFLAAVGFRWVVFRQKKL